MEPAATSDNTDGSILPSHTPSPSITNNGAIKEENTVAPKQNRDSLLLWLAFVSNPIRILSANSVAGSDG